MKIGRKFPQPARINWRLKKARAAYINRREWFTEYNPIYTTDIEIVTGETYGICLEQASLSSPTLIIQE